MGVSLNIFFRTFKNNIYFSKKTNTCKLFLFWKCKSWSELLYYSFFLFAIKFLFFSGIKVLMVTWFLINTARLHFFSLYCVYLQCCLNGALSATWGRRKITNVFGVRLNSWFSPGFWRVVQVICTSIMSLPLFSTKTVKNTWHLMCINQKFNLKVQRWIVQVYLNYHQSLQFSGHLLMSGLVSTHPGTICLQIWRIAKKKVVSVCSGLSKLRSEFDSRFYKGSYKGSL